MTNTPEKSNEPQRRRAPGARGQIAGMIALVALFVIVAAWFWSTYRPLPPTGVVAGLGMPHGIMVAGAGAFIAALIAEIRAMSLSEILEAAWELLLGLFALVGSILKGIWNGILSLFGWD